VGKLKLLYDQSGNRKYLNPSERLQFYELVLASENLDHRSFCLTLIYSGCRISEALNLRRGNIDEAEKNLVFKTLKQRGEERTRSLPVPDELVEHLLEQASANRGSKIWSFTRWTGWRIVKAYMAEAGLTGAKATPKGLRHAFAIDNLSKEVPLTTISKWLGHANIDTTKIYLDFIGPEERALARRAWPESKSSRVSEGSTSSDGLEEIECFEVEISKNGTSEEITARIAERRIDGWVVSRIEWAGGMEDGGLEFQIVFLKA
jgi:integrase/recombinase XerD